MDLDKAIGFESEPAPTAWVQRDILLYATGIGAKRDELQFVFEDDPNWHPFPTYPLVLGFKGTSPDITDFNTISKAGGVAPGLPFLSPKTLVHGEQSIQIFKRIPSVSGPGWKSLKKLVGIKETPKGLIVDSATDIVDPKGEVYARMTSSTYHFGKFNAGGYSKSIAPKRVAEPSAKPPARKPDIVFIEKTTPETALVYRLSGDTNPLHIFPDIGKAMGFPGAILHGLCTFGHAARAVVLKAAGGDGRRLSFISSRFTSPVMPGDELETSLWLSEVPEGTRVDFVMRIVNTGKQCLGGGVALIAPPTKL